MNKHRILYDTNIILHREDYHVISAEFLALCEVVNKLDRDIVIHPLSLIDINNDKDEMRKSVSLSKLKTYKVLQNFPKFENDENFMSSINLGNRQNDMIDNHMLYAVYKNAVDFLITEDKEILAKGKKLGLGDKVLNLNVSRKIFEKYLPKENSTVLSCFKIQKGWNVDLGDEIFNSLKKEYDFERWWSDTVCGKNRDVYVFTENNIDGKSKINAILIMKEEGKEVIDCTPALILGSRLKICLFKVSSNSRGLKLGERLLKIAFEEAILKGLNDIYLTHYIKPDDYLVKMIEDYGFYCYGYKKDGEAVFVKHILPERKPIFNGIKDVLFYNKKYFPSFYDGALVNKHIVPIKPEFHSKLFPDYKKDVTQLKLFNVPPASEGFSIKKAYVCYSNSQRINQGDVLLFYRSTDDKVITSIGIVEKVYYGLNDKLKVLNLISKRTVYTEVEIEKMCIKPVTVLLFKHNFNLLNVFSFAKLKEDGIVNGNIQSITEVKDDYKYNSILRGRINECYTIH